MTTLCWFGGRSDAGPAPVGARHIHPDLPPLWICGAWPEHEVRTAVAGPRRVTILGPCSATPGQLAQLARTGTTDQVASAFTGAYTVIEPSPAATIIYTDPGHVCPIYLARTSGGVLWGSSALALAALIGADVDQRWLAATLAGLRPGVLAGRSPFTGITAVPPGARLHLDQHGHIQIRTTWRPPAATLDLPDGAQALRAVLREAVAVRLQPGQVTSADCSGGLDSTSLTLLAASLCGPADAVQAITVHPEGITSGGDLDYARAATGHHPGIRHLLCPLGQQHLPYTAMTELLPVTDEPAPGTITIARAVAEFDLLCELGSTCHFTGDGGDTLLGWHPSYLAEHLRTGRVRTAWHQGLGWARLRRIPVWPVLRTALATVTSRDYPARPVLRWLTGHARALADEQAAATVPPPKEPVGQAVLLEAMRLVARTAHADRQLAAAYGVRVHNPFTDAQVLHAVLATKTAQRATPYRYKPLLATAMTGLLPPAVAARRTKGDFTADHHQGLREHHTQLRHLTRGQLAERGLIDPEAMAGLIDQAAAGVPVLFSDFEPLLATEAWLRVLADHTSAASWPPARQIQECGR
jgi:asparagine synthase (glutamine-hydrolysing)